MSGFNYSSGQTRIKAECVLCPNCAKMSTETPDGSTSVGQSVSHVTLGLRNNCFTDGPALLFLELLSKFPHIKAVTLDCFYSVCDCKNLSSFPINSFSNFLPPVSSRLSLDPDTAHPTLVLLEGPQGAHCGEEPQSYPPHPQRFDSVAQVLCREGQFGGASYWEVEWRGGGWVDIGVTYRGIGRKGGGKPCLLGRNENSWRLRCTQAGYAAWHDNRKTTVAAPPCPRIGVFLERQKGALSFYSVSDTVVLLHTFRCPFSQPLYPAFRLDLDSTLLICPHDGGNGNPT